MPGLRELGFVMDYEGQFLSRGKGVAWAMPITELRGVRWLRVGVWDRIRAEDGTGEDVEGARRKEEVMNEWLRGWVCQGREAEWKGE